MKKRFGCLMGVSVLVGGMMASVAQPVDTKDLQLTGNVYDASGASIPGADVIVRVKGQQIADAKTDVSGEFRFQGAAGAYDLTVLAGGFKTLHSDGVSFANGSGVKLVVSPEMSGDPRWQGAYTSPSLPTVSPLLSSSISPLPSSPILVQRGADVEPVPALANAHAWNFGALVQGGVGLQDRTDFSFFMVGGHAGKALTSEIGTGLFKGNLEYGVEVFPLWQSYTPKFSRILCQPGVKSAAQCSAPYTVGGKFTGASITPIILRWNLTHGQRLMPWIQGVGGVVWTNHKYPAVGDLNFADPTQTGYQANTSVWNFTPQGGVGAHYFVRHRRSIDFAVNAVHISSASLGDKNPGVNTSLQFSVGYSWWK